MSITPLKTPNETPASVVPAPEERLTLRRAAIAMGIGVALILLTAIAIRYTEMVTGRYISHGVPPLPAFAALLIFSLLRPVLAHNWPRLAPTRGQIFLIYIMLTVATILSGSYHVRAFLPHLVSLQYHERPGGLLAGNNHRDFLPDWLFPKDPAIVEDYYNGAKSHTVPWGAWLGPLAIWSLLFAAIFVGVYCLMRLVQKQWIQSERLSFPLLALPLAMTSEDWSAYGPRINRRTLFLMGLAVPVLFNGLNILHVLQPMVPAPGFYIGLTEYFPNRPWQPLGNIYLFFMLEAVGIGYFVPLEVTFSTWFFYLCNRLFAVGGTAVGYDAPNFPYTQDQSLGSYLAVGLFLLWGLRRAFGQSFRRSFSRRQPGEESERWAWIGVIGCSLFILGFFYAAGLSLKLGLPYFLILALFVLVYARIRAETGVPFGFIYPYGLPKEGLLNAVSFETAQSWGGQRSIVMFSTLAWLSRHHYASEQAAYQLDGIKLSQEGGIGRRTLGMALLVAFAVGLAAAFWVHLATYYDMGSNMAGGTVSGEFRATVAMQEYQQMASRLSNPPVRDTARVVAIGGGFLFTAALQWLRLQWLGSPFHPLGYLLGLSYGDSSAMWFPLFLAWSAKAAILKLGGLRFYRRGIPFFLGLTIGHFFMAGIFWPVLSVFIAPEASRAYHLYFGG